MQPDLNALMHNAARLLAATVAKLPPDRAAMLEAALAGGAVPVVEIGPNPAAPAIRVLLVGPEGARHELAALSLREVPQCAH